MIIDIITLFPEMFDGFLSESIIKRAIGTNRVAVNVVNLRDYTLDKHLKVDDTPYGGGSGMVIACQPVYDAIKALKKQESLVLLMTPQGKVYQQAEAETLAKHTHLILLCGHYEGFDARIAPLIDGEISIGDYVLTGGELASMVVADSIIRLLPGVIKEDSHQQDSHSNGLLEHPHYTKPRVFEGMEVPEVLLNGNHKEIDTWRHKESLRNTYLKRPDMLMNRQLTDQEKKWIKEFSDGNKTT